ncbi:hypothetical protein B6A09_1700 [Saccharomyces cerevisiae synthetic construct]|uniref:Putative uncharacterized protein YBR206W n=3 Tax=Saccharomyces cerevisiae TaxID=4932 RepID=YB56_YEAST|nr:RecName: Full=Putative uncharacterized protein YBR206W [Saccharomyces cerevisiae S288C]AAT93320.1 YBR206W [Saccharomyces cerevisiae]ARB02015.1 hypothetical protein B6A09_1700 [Saccharomyces cerevisiae synthetic construct]EIW12141.1 hypothetical protein CENPK1137D_4759 [Saccharomyces cerevisiae CEN.PK113-7D]CBK39283.1 EC1118_1B15_3774p [Saccharomyces cerevisiae EC1118]WNV72108.1 hypothetical protein O6U65_0355 [Saccharomyces cerevisiae synthetic construct]
MRQCTPSLPLCSWTSQKSISLTVLDSIIQISPLVLSNRRLDYKTSVSANLARTSPGLLTTSVLESTFQQEITSFHQEFKNQTTNSACSVKTGAKTSTCIYLYTHNSM